MRVGEKVRGENKGRGEKEDGRKVGWSEEKGEENKGEEGGWIEGEEVCGGK